MRGSQKSKRVSWASDVNLCQVRLFLSDESPSQAGLGTQDHLQAKASWLSHPAGTVSDDFLPPGFEGGQTANQSHIKLANIPIIKWRCPPRFVLDLTWQVVAGEESEDVEVQNQREMRVLEAVYPRSSAIPTNPIFCPDVEDFRHGDHQVPLIPIHPIEDEDATDLASDVKGSHDVPISSQSQLLAPPAQCSIPFISNTPINEKPAAGVLPGVEPDVVAAASAAFSAINKSNEQGSLIDHDLLIKILNNPKLIEKLVQDYGTASNVQSTPKAAASFTHLPDPPPPPQPPVSLSEPSYMHMNNRADMNAPSFTATSSGPFYGQPNGVGPIYLPKAPVPPPPPPPPVPAPPSVGVPQMKDMNYYKNLIQQHGGERQEAPHQYSNRYSHHVGTSQESVNPKSRDSKHKIMKPCIYFNSSRGCRHGANCAFQHDASTQQRSSSISEVQTAKRMKLDREISS
ncbi:zinc finger CCCH domain-containing protein 6 [Mercurialis annua]|uniref:zinc finger CCCH domain-containing protein 6 n=1 Tax=Mercurialis annua TaxID=3986 RepID=UPI00215E6D21|nr:zinc finger CCCH domain-containing protein 6 [Mercurialis annua]